MRAVAASAYDDIKEQTATGLQHVMETKSVIEIGVRLASSFVVIPQNGRYKEYVMVWLAYKHLFAVPDFPAALIEGSMRNAQLLLLWLKRLVPGVVYCLIQRGFELLLSV